jgi:putative Holliday junction resolvase
MATDVLLGLDVGSVRIGVALARSDVRIAQPLTTIDNTDRVYDVIRGLVSEHGVAAIVVGWPRGMQGQVTEQTKFAEAFVEALRQQVRLPVYLQDEALTSQKAETELRNRNKPFEKSDVDALAATYILDDYLAASPGSVHV